MIISARDPFNSNKKVRYNKTIQRYEQTEKVYVYDWLPQELKSKVLSYLSNPEADKQMISVAKKKYDYMNSEIMIESDDLQQFKILQYKWCGHCGERSTIFARSYNCDCESKNEI